MLKGWVSVMVKVRGSTAFHSTPPATMARPKLSRLVQRWREAITSAVVTAEPSEKLRPGRSVKVHCL